MVVAVSTKKEELEEVAARRLLVVLRRPLPPALTVKDRRNKVEDNMILRCCSCSCVMQYCNYCRGWRGEEEDDDDGETCR